jgi:preprotein translocase subunit Sec61beta
MPASSAGLLRFFEDETHGVKVRPEAVIIIAAVMTVLSILLLLLVPPGL